MSKIIDENAVEEFRYFVSGIKDAEMIISHQMATMYRYNYNTQKEMTRIASYYLKMLGVGGQ